MTEPAAALRAGNGLGGFFALAIAPDLSGWRSMDELVTDPVVWDGHVSWSRAALASDAGVGEGAIEPRVAASLAQLGLAARLVSPALAAMASEAWVPDLNLAMVHWQPCTASPIPMAVEEIRGQQAVGATALAQEFDRLVVGPALVPLNAAVVSSGLGVSPHIAWGNTWSALAGALTPLRTQRPDLAPAARAIVAAILRDRPDAGGFDEATGRFRRSTCCLYFRLPRGGLCGDCVLDAAPATSRS